MPACEHIVPCHGCQVPAGDSAQGSMAKDNMLSPTFLQSLCTAADGSLKMLQMP